jgi:uncharacterized repeat protein (TIGR03803 family)
MHMKIESSWRRHLHAATSALLLLSGATTAYGLDIYNPTNHQLTIGSVTIGSATYTNMVVAVGTVVTRPEPGTPNGEPDSYDPQTNLLTVKTVDLGPVHYVNGVVTVAGFISCSGVTGADSYGGGVLSISQVQVGPTIYRGVQVALGAVLSVGGGMPTFVPDTYSAPNNQLAIPAVQVGGRVYTNVIISVANLLAVSGISSTFQQSTLYSFGSPGNSDGANPQAGLIQGSSDGLLYGTTTDGGTLLGGGTVFTISTSGTEHVLYAFCSVGGAQCTDGEDPVAGLIQVGANFYGTTEIGGAYGQGTLFQVTPGGVESVIYSFCGTSGSGACPANDGALPQAGLIQASDGNFYGTTFAGGKYGQGTVFQVTPGGVEKVLHSFTGNNAVPNSTDGAQPQSTLIQARDGNLYGTTYMGGADDNGTVFKITTGGTESTLYSFVRGSDGRNPKAGVIQGADGNFYGTTYTGGSTNGGTVFKVTPAGTETVLYSFNQSQVSTDGYAPRSGLLQAQDGNIYGVTNDGGTSGPGTIFKITPDGIETVLYSFSNGGTNAIFPQAVLFQDSTGVFYGTTYDGGTAASGTVFRLTNLL